MIVLRGWGNVVLGNPGGGSGTELRVFHKDFGFRGEFSYQNTMKLLVIAFALLLVVRLAARNTSVDFRRQCDGIGEDKGKLVHLRVGNGSKLVCTADS